jgi:hypothetical protein
MSYCDSFPDLLFKRLMFLYQLAVKKLLELRLAFDSCDAGEDFAFDSF